MTATLAIEGGSPVRTEPFPTWPIFDEREEQKILAVLHSGQWSILDGEQVNTFERQFAEFQQAKFGVCVPNGTLALQLALEALDIGPGDEVITTPYTFIATASAALQVGAIPIFVDIEWESFNLDPDQIEAAITERTKAIIPVHIAGRPANLSAILDIAQRHQLAVLEDACQAWGASWRGQRVGAIGDLGTFSFQASKNITAGEGGIVITNYEALYEKYWSLHNVGRTRRGAWYHHELLGGNLRMTEWQGAILQAQLERLPEHLQTREANARYLSEALSEIEGLSPLAEDVNITEQSRHLFILRYDKTAFGNQSRDDFIKALQAEGIDSANPGYVPLYRSPAIRNTLLARCGPDSSKELPLCPVAERASQEGIWLGQNIFLGTQGDVDSVVEAINKIQKAWA